MHWVWLTKHVSDFCGNNVQLYHWSKGTHSPKCELKDRLTIPAHHDIINRVESYARSDPDTLLPHHRFLFEADSEELVSGPTSHRLLWLADMDIAIATSSLGRLGTLTPQASPYFLQTRQLVWCKPGWTTL